MRAMDCINKYIVDDLCIVAHDLQAIINELIQRHMATSSKVQAPLNFTLGMISSKILMEI